MGRKGLWKDKTVSHQQEFHITWVCNFRRNNLELFQKHCSEVLWSGLSISRAIQKL
jgi:hypothetical protein